MDFDLFLDQMLFVYCQPEDNLATERYPALHLCAGMCTLLKNYVLVTDDQQQLAEQLYSIYFETCPCMSMPQS